jgi:hypothetical protein
MKMVVVISDLVTGDENYPVLGSLVAITVIWTAD